MEFPEYLSVLRDPAADVNAGDLTALDSLSAEEASAFDNAWRAVDVERRREIVRLLGELAEDNVELNFDPVFLAALSDNDGEVRRQAIRGLWEYEGRDLIGRLLEALARDEEPEVRAEAALGLGRFVLLFETGGLLERRYQKIERALRKALEDELEEEVVRARALEAVGASSREWVQDAIAAAYEGEEERLRIAAVHAMGRSCDPRWLTTLREELGSDEAEVRYEAATALGLLEDKRAVGHLSGLLQDGDPQVQEAVILALGRIGGREAKALLRPLAQDGSPSVQQAAEAALAEADFGEDPLSVEYRV